MSKKILFLLLMSFMGVLSLAAQDLKDTKDTDESKYAMFTSVYGQQIKIRDYKVDGLKGGWTHYGLNSTVRVIWADQKVGYFANLEAVDPSNKNPSAFMAEDDLFNIIAAIKVMKDEVEKDIALAPEYFENKYVTSDGFQIGYYVEASGKKTNLQWFYKLNPRSTSYKIDIDKVLQVLENTMDKIKEIKQ